MEFRDMCKVDLLAFDTTGSTAIAYTPYLDMRGVRKADFFIMGRGALPTTANSTAIQTLTAAIYQSTGSTGPSATQIANTSAVLGKMAAGVVVAATCMADELYIQFTTLASAATFSINGVQWSFDSTADATARVLNSTGATANASVASEAFKTNFNSTANNTFATAWQCATLTSALVKIYKVDPEANTYITATGSTLVNIGIGKAAAQIGIDQTCLKDGYRYVSVGVIASDTAAPYSVMAVREYEIAGTMGRTIQERTILPRSTGR
jgi:hypothetical protein